VWGYPAASLAALVPSFWLPHIQAGDLASHVYNAWLAQLIGQGKAPGLVIVPQSTNVMFDRILAVLLPAVGGAAAERIAVSLAVLVFVWGAFAFCRAVAGSAWPVFPAILAISYGWVFHMGFFNFYIGLGLSFWALACAWKFQPRGLAAAAALFALAYVAHGLPVVWAFGVLAYVWICRRTAPYPWWRLGGAAGAIVLSVVLLAAGASVHWRPEQRQFFWGVNEVWVYAISVPPATILLGALFAFQFAMLVRAEGVRRVLGGEMFQVCLLTSFGIRILPDRIDLPWYQHPLAFLTERSSLPLAICLCALVALAPTRRWYPYAAAAVALVFFAALFGDERTLNGFEDAEDALIAGLPPLQRVISSVEMPNEHVTTVSHLVDRLCVGRCYSFGNYEVASAQFRIRAAGPQRMVVTRDDDTRLMQTGAYVVKPEDAPLYQIEALPDGKLRVRELPVGRPNGLTFWNGPR
jgi:hypothetical protein